MVILPPLFAVEREILPVIVEPLPILILSMVMLSLLLAVEREILPVIFAELSRTIPPCILELLVSDISPVKLALLPLPPVEFPPIVIPLVILAELAKEILPVILAESWKVIFPIVPWSNEKFPSIVALSLAVIVPIDEVALPMLITFHLVPALLTFEVVLLPIKLIASTLAPSRLGSSNRITDFQPSLRLVTLATDITPLFVIFCIVPPPLT